MSTSDNIVAGRARATPLQGSTSADTYFELELANLDYPRFRKALAEVTQQIYDGLGFDTIQVAIPSASKLVFMLIMDEIEEMEFDVSLEEPFTEFLTPNQVRLPPSAASTTPTLFAERGSRTVVLTLVESPSYGTMGWRAHEAYMMAAEQREAYFVEKYRKIFESKLAKTSTDFTIEVPLPKRVNKPALSQVLDEVEARGFVVIVRSGEKVRLQISKECAEGGLTRVLTRARQRMGEMKRIRYDE